MDARDTGSVEDIWVFGYGSLIWRVDFPYAESRAAYIIGYARRFWQGSIDHRGLPEAPGRVVTLAREPRHRCYGMAYRLEAERAEQVMAQLDHREKGGYRRLELDIHFDDSGSTRGLTYLATPGNPNYLGPARLEEIAAQVVRSAGPSGPNIEYVLQLADYLEEHDVRDSHVLDLARAVRKLLA